METSNFVSTLQRAAQNALQRGDKERARKFINQALELAPQEAENWYLAGLIVSDPAKSIQALERTLQLQPDHVQAQILLAQLRPAIPPDLAEQMMTEMLESLPIAVTQPQPQAQPQYVFRPKTVRSMPTRRNPRLRTVAIVVGILIFLARLLGTGTGPTLPLEGACKYSTVIGLIDAQCGVVTVPEDRAHPEGRKLNISYRVIPPIDSGAHGLPIFHLEGGPGGSAIDGFAQGWVSSYQLLHQDHPIVLIDQRGTGVSSPLKCSEISNPILTDLAVNRTLDQEQTTTIDRLGQCLNRLSQQTDPQFYTTSNLADDTDVVRAALGYDQIDIFGNSYGTSLGQIYLKRHGDHVAAMILDSVVGPWDNWNYDGANNAQAALEAVFALCQTDPACNAAYPDLSFSLQQSYSILKSAPTYDCRNAYTCEIHKVAVNPRRFTPVLQHILLH